MSTPQIFMGQQVSLVLNGLPIEAQCTYQWVVSLDFVDS